MAGEHGALSARAGRLKRTTAAAIEAEATLGDDDEILADGVMADTGRPLPGAPLLIPQPVAASVHNERDAADKRLAQIAAGKMQSYSVDANYDPNSLEGVGWGLVFPAAGDSAAIEQALAPLITLRKTQVKDEKRCRIFKGQDGYQAGETAVQWLGRHNVGLDVVNPRQGVPYYLMLVGSPDSNPDDVSIHARSLLGGWPALPAQRRGILALRAERHRLREAGDHTRNAAQDRPVRHRARF